LYSFMVTVPECRNSHRGRCIFGPGSHKFPAEAQRTLNDLLSNA